MTDDEYGRHADGRQEDGRFSVGSHCPVFLDQHARRLRCTGDGIRSGFGISTRTFTALAKVLAAYLLINALLMGVFAWSLGQLHIGFGLVLLIGIFVNGCVAGLYALTPTLYATEQRVTGLGWGIGIGRMGAILSPLVAGKLIDADWQPADLYPLFAVAFILAALAVSLMKPIAIAPLRRTSQP